MSTKVFIGIDPSYSNTSIVIITKDEDGLIDVKKYRLKTSKKDGTYAYRATMIIKEFSEIINNIVNEFEINEGVIFMNTFYIELEQPFWGDSQMLSRNLHYPIILKNANDFTTIIGSRMSHSTKSLLLLNGAFLGYMASRKWVNLSHVAIRSATSHLGITKIPKMERKAWVWKQYPELKRIITNNDDADAFIHALNIYRNHVDIN